MSVKILQNQKQAADKELRSASHLLYVLPVEGAQKLAQESTTWESLKAVLKRKNLKLEELAATPVSADLPHGGTATWVLLDGKKTRFEQLTTMRKAAQAVLAENPAELTISVAGAPEARALGAETAVYVVLLNACELPSRKQKKSGKALKAIKVYGFKSKDDFGSIKALAEGNSLTRELTVLPPNELTPGLYRRRIRKLAKEAGWQLEEFDLKKLRKMGAGAFVAVAQGSVEEDAAIVHLRYRPKGAKKTVALVGKGICFDTGGHNLKPARYMHGMHEDMNGSAVALGILSAATRMGLQVNIDCWLALAQNHISPHAYKQNDVVTALNGTTIEIVHTDAEGRMVLADTLTMAARQKPDLMLDFATLTGSCIGALGNRYSGVFGNRAEWLAKAVDAGGQTGERVCAFPSDADYEETLDSKIADIKQCVMAGEADHILATRFLMRFVEDTPWIHMDLAASRNEGGLGAVASDVTGFGVAWGVKMLEASV